MDRVSEVTRDAHKADDAMRQHWNSVVANELGCPSYYQSVAVLLIQWANWLDPDLQREEEVCTPRYLTKDVLTII